MRAFALALLPVEVAGSSARSPSPSQFSNTNFDPTPVPSTTTFPGSPSPSQFYPVPTPAHWDNPSRRRLSGSPSTTNPVPARRRSSTPSTTTFPGSPSPSQFYPTPSGGWAPTPADGCQEAWEDIDMLTICGDLPRLHGLINLGVCSDGRLQVLLEQCGSTCGLAAVQAQGACRLLAGDDPMAMCRGACAAAAQDVFDAGCTDNDMYWDDDRKMMRMIMDMMSEHREGCNPNGCMGAVMEITQACTGLDTSPGNELSSITMLCQPNTTCSDALKKPMAVCSDTDTMWDDGQQADVNVKEQLGQIQMICGMLSPMFDATGNLDAAGMAALMAALAGDGGGGGGSCNNPIHLPRSTPAFQKYPPRACGIAAGAMGMSGVASAWLLGLAFLFRQ